MALNASTVVIDDTQRERLRRLTRSHRRHPPPGSHPRPTRDGHRLLAEHLADDGISASQIGRILADLDLKPLTRRPDPDFFVKAAEICDLYAHLPAGSVVICVNEKTAIAARSRKRSYIVPAKSSA